MAGHVSRSNVTYVLYFLQTNLVGGFCPTQLNNMRKSNGIISPQKWGWKLKKWCELPPARNACSREKNFNLKVNMMLNEAPVATFLMCGVTFWFEMFWKFKSEDCHKTTKSINIYTVSFPVWPCSIILGPGNAKQHWTQLIQLTAYWQLSIPKTVTRWPPTAKHSYMEDSEMDSLLVDGLRPS